MDLSIIIVNWNAGAFLPGCLESIKSSLFDLQYEVILVDNCSTDGSMESIRERFPRLLYGKCR